MFAELEKHQPVLYKYLIDSIGKRNLVSHAYLFEYDDFDSAYNFVKQFAKFLLCSENDNSIKYLIDTNQYKDYYEVVTDKQTIKKEEILLLQNEFKTKPLRKYKMYVITDASKLTTSSANTLLKFLEEPEDGVVAVLLCRNKYQIIETIRSRCQLFSLTFNINSTPNEELIIKFLEDIYINKYFFFTSDYLQKYSFLEDKIKLIEICQHMVVFVSKYLSGKIECENILSKMENSDIIRLSLQIYNYIDILKYNVNLKLANDKFILDLIEVISCMK